METIIIWIAVAFGFAYGVGHSVVSLRARVWLAQFEGMYWPLALVECPACLGFWTGMIVGAVMSHDALFALGGGLFTMATNFMLGRMTGLIPHPRGEIEHGDGMPVQNASGDDARRAEGADSRRGEN